jgi:hypothetical protein
MSCGWSSRLEQTEDMAFAPLWCWRASQCSGLVGVVSVGLGVELDHF